MILRARHRNQRRSRGPLGNRTVTTLSACEALRVSQQARKTRATRLARSSGARQDGFPNHPASQPQPGAVRYSRAMVLACPQSCSLSPPLRPKAALPLSATSCLKNSVSCGVFLPTPSVLSSRMNRVYSRLTARKNSTSVDTSRCGFLHQSPAAFTCVSMRSGRLHDLHPKARASAGNQRIFCARRLRAKS